MRRWNGWGDDHTVSHLPAAAAGFLAERVGSGKPPEDITLAEVVAAVSPSRLPAHALVSQEPASRVLHARGQSLPDWIALRSGQIAAFPDGVAYPTNDSEVSALIHYAAEVGARLIPYGGGTSVVGHINPQPGDAPVLTVDLRRLNQLHRFNVTSLLATFGAGVVGPDLEAQLRARGYTLGHFPQSFEYSTLGGWVATRSSGQQSLRYGRIEELFAGGRVESPAGTLEMPPFPASAAGPDLRQVILGSEGRMGIITEATVRVVPLPEEESFHALFFPDWGRGQTAVRAIAQAQLPLSMMRLSTPNETTTNLALAGHPRLLGLFQQVLGMRGAGEDKSMAILGFTGSRREMAWARKEALALARAQGGIAVGTLFGSQWKKNRFRAPYLRNTLWEMGYAVDTLETATTWDKVPGTVDAIEQAIRSALTEWGERVHVFTHLSHLYPTGSSIYTTYLFRLASTPEETLRRWQALKGTASRALVACGATISHQHGVGVDHAPYVGAEKGALGLSAVATLCQHFDPKGMMNPAVLLPQEG
ncbi:MAG: FAD-binding oxidoreductase [Ardenticatenales bacterium]|nr:FAD-binding oxidoreductase [Ardenticatenales bacterium]